MPPIYQYELTEGKCDDCGGAFELIRSLSDPPVTRCPVCKKSVRKCFGQVSTPKISKKPSTIDAKKAGFQVLKRRDKGVYEKL